MSQLGSMRKYRWKSWHRILRLLPILANVLLLAFLVYGLIILTGAIVHLRSPAAICLIPVLLSLMVLALVRLPLLIVRVGNLMASYVIVSPDALEIRLWPFYRVRLRWEDVERVGKTPSWGGSYEMLRLEEAKELTEGPTAIRLRKMLRWFVRNKRHSFSLKSIHGYPQGDFADDLRRYAPHLFTIEKGPEAQQDGIR